MPTYTQEKRPLAVETPLGADALLLTAFTGVEEFSKLFHFELELLSEKNSIQSKEIIGKNVTFWVEHADGKPRYFNGHVQRFSYGGRNDRLSIFRATVVPWLWFLTRTTDCRIFQKKSIPQIIEEVVSDAGFVDKLDKSGLSGSHPEWDYCVQYRETDFAFLSRLMEIEGIFYFFRHEQGKHTLVLGDAPSAYATCQDSSVQMAANLSQPTQADQILAWEHQYEFRSGKWVHTDYNFETSTTSLIAQTNSVLGLPEADKFELFDYPGEYEKKDQGDNDIKLRMEEEEAGYDVVRGQSMCRSFGPGYKFELAKHHNPDEAGKGYVLTSVRHQARLSGDYVVGGSGGGNVYRNSFACIPDSVVFRPPRSTKKPLIHGVQTAVVVGPPGDEIYCDKYGRVKVHFHWDRLGKKDGDDSCWVRVASNSAGRNWGSMLIPRIGWEVVVTHLEGDPDRPLITGVVHNDSQMPPYPLPDEKTKFSLKSNSSPGGEGFNEIRFEDSAGKEQFYLHAQKDMDLLVLNDRLESVERDMHLTVANDSYELIGNNKDVQIDGKYQEGIKSDVRRLVGGDEHEHIYGKRMVSLEKDDEATITGNKIEKVGESVSQTIGMDLLQSVGKNAALDAGMTVHIKAGMTMILEAGLQLSLKVGGNFIDLSPVGVAINGMPLVMINSGGAAGSGPGCSPKTPTKPEKAEPKAPKAADKTAITGQKSAP
jgi:type VI secretion system secreted protein VgrG